ncbi:RNase adapter RapZ [Clostridium sp. MD294]|uniref:RNase adapter RapZ n=1 Tax=Clostridium sp. MD294 TaxID=97138 RepID=UPI0002C9933E|nr:RNase adapter RapZ [Clostridium sp. MD294]NDO45865.1 RNase adapter RapZ [Clostridium sp. MD294]USF30477.1 Nucleotide-binding protein [Clostridium sp. MD294]
MRFVIVTGMSGAGKSTVLRFLEDINFFCVDNLPPALLPKFAELCYEQGGEIDKVAMGIDIRGGKLFSDLFSVLSELQVFGYDYEILFLDASEKTLIKRYKESRRSHPLSKGGSIAEGIIKERQMLEEVKKKATYIIETSHILTRELKEQINKIFLENQKFESLIITVCSFGFKYGIPVDSDLVFDVRFLPNPFYIQELKELTGNDAPVYDYVMNFEESNVFLQKLTDMLEFLIPQYIKEGKNQLIISIGCTGGKHRSVTLANALYKKLYGKNHTILLKHNDIEKDVRHKKF